MIMVRHFQEEQGNEGNPASLPDLPKAVKVATSDDNLCCCCTSCSGDLVEAGDEKWNAAI